MGELAELPPDDGTPRTANDARKTSDAAADAPVEEEIGGPKGPEPTRYGDWERKGRCIDF
jgi:hypothetical protein